MSIDQEIRRLLGTEAPPFAILHRPQVHGSGHLELLVGDVTPVARLADLPIPVDPAPGTGPELLALVPYRQLGERGFACRDDGTPLLGMTVHRHWLLPVTQLAQYVPDDPVELRDGGFDVSDEEYASIVRTVISDEIGRGEGSNFVIKRAYQAAVPGFSTRTALAMFLRLLAQEQGSYWTFLVYTGERTLVGASPERHVSLAGGTVTMNPISGTYRYPPGGPTVTGALRFLADRKEADELYMVVDEELKMMGRICDLSPRVRGPFLKEMGKVAHTEYLLTGPSTRDVRDILRQTMFAPTVTGSPLENACRAVTRHEPGGRGYYSGMLALIGREQGQRTLDAAIAIRTADIDSGGRLALGVGATVVRHSDPAAEVAETAAKADGLLSAITSGSGRPARGRAAARSLATHRAVRRALTARNAHLSQFWLRPDGYQGPITTELVRRRILVVDAEDTFTAMLAFQLRSLGPTVTVRRFDEPFDIAGHDAVVVGPGPGDPRDDGDRKIAILRETTRRLLAEGRPFLSVCLGHQVLAWTLGLGLVRLPAANQGAQHRIPFFGRRERAGFYNSFAAHSDRDEFHSPATPEPVRVSRDPASGVVHGLRGATFRSMQFHPESVLTVRGPELLAQALTTLPLAAPAAGRTEPAVPFPG